MADLSEIAQKEEEQDDESLEIFVLESAERERQAAERLAENPQATPDELEGEEPVSDLLAMRYVEYLQVYKKLEMVCDQMVHPQKLRLVKKLLEACIGRILELRQRLTRMNGTEFISLDAVLLEKGLTPDAIDILPPRFALTERITKVAVRRKELETLKAQLVPDASDRPVLSKDEALLILQRNERARQGRRRHKNMFDIMRQEEAEAQRLELDNPEIERGQAAALIQPLWRGHMARERVRRMRRMEQEFIGMSKAKDKTVTQSQNLTLTQNKEKDKQESVETEDEARQRRIALRSTHTDEYRDAVVSIRQEMLDNEELKETMRDETLKHIFEQKEVTGKLPDIPRTEDGGSTRWFPIDDAELSSAEEDEPTGKRGKRKKKGKGKGKGKKAEEKESKAKPKNRKDKEEEVEEKPRFLSIFDKQLAISRRKFESVWDKRDESSNFAQRYDASLVREQLMPEVHRELRGRVDELLRVELTNLRMALGKKGKGRRKAEKKKRKKKGGVKGSVDTIDESEIDTIAWDEELIRTGVLLPTPQPSKYSISNFIGSTSILNQTLKMSGMDISPSLGDIRRVMIEVAAMPICSPFVHRNEPDTPSRGVLLVGPEGSGKKTMASMIAADLGATFIDLSPARLAKEQIIGGLAATKSLVLTSFKLAKARQPAVILIDGVEKLFGKGKVKGDKEKEKEKSDVPIGMEGTGVDGTASTSASPAVVFNARHLKGPINTQLNKLDEGDRIATSSKPWEGDSKALASFFSHVIHVPPPSYADRVHIWTSMMKICGFDPPLDFDMSTLARVSEGYTAGSIIEACKAVLTKDRLKRLHTRPARPSEFLSVIARHVPMVVGEDEEFVKFMAKTPMYKGKSVKKRQ